jgi:aldehyde dehydrogenase (NAD+)
MSNLYRSFYINGQWQPGQGSVFRPVINPATEAVIAEVVDGTVEDVDAAVKAARQAFSGWSKTPAAERERLISALKDALKIRAELLAETISAEMGMPLAMARSWQVSGPLYALGLYAKRAHLMDEVEEVGSAVIVKEPVGVCGFITPWNVPLGQLIGKVAPALAAGCTMVLKPSEITPLHAFIVAEAIDEVGFPAGVFNLVCGDGPVVGEAICTHPDVDMVSFTGSTRAGVRIAELAAPSVKRVCQELGGKSPLLITEDADLGAAVRFGVNDVMVNSGQVCCALTRMLIPRSRYDEAVALAKTAAESLHQGDPTDPDAYLGPLSSQLHYQRVRQMISAGIDEGATLVCGGLEPPEGVDKGFYVRPTIFTNVNNQMTIARQEVFGPVLCMIPYDGIEQGIQIANDTPYGLAAAVWAGNKKQGLLLARQLRAGQVSVNGGDWNYEVPFGGYKQSGNGREWGDEGLREYIELKAIRC